MKTSTIKWGVIGLGNIAHQFVRDLALIKEAELYAVASRSINKAKDFGTKHKAKKMYGSYQELMNDPNIDIIYIATPHDSHKNLTIESLESGKHVLCEKPIAINYEQTKAMIDASKKQNKFLMEAFWTRFNPSIQQILYKIKQGDLGDIKYVNADFAFRVENPTGRMTDITNAGGSLLDMGVYPLMLSYIVLGKPKKVLATSNFFESGADKQTAMILQYENAQAVLHSSFVSPSNMSATISGTKGRLNIHSIWHETQGFSILKNGHKIDYHYPTLGKGFTYEIEECHRCIQNNQIESKLWTHQNSFDVIEIADEVRKQSGLKFPNKL
jgi:predicted dehydrogenase